MARPKGKLFALIAIFAAIGLVAATGAFTSVSAQRTANVTVQGDDAALLQLAPSTDPNSPSNGNTYAQVTSGTLELVNLQNLNLDANTTIKRVFNVTNGGGNDVALWITKEGGDIAPGDGLQFFVNSTGDTAAFGTNVTQPLGTDANPTRFVVVSPGETVQVSMIIDTTKASEGTGNSVDTLIQNINIYADQEEAP